MSGARTTNLGLAPPPASAAARLGRSDRRNALLDAAAALITSAGLDAVTMETVADRAGVSRALVYKHFANRSHLLTEVYRREAELLHTQLAAGVYGATSLETMYRALIRGVLRATEQRRAVFLALRTAGARDDKRRQEQRDRDRATVQFFTARAIAEFGLPPAQAEAATEILLGGIDSIIARWRREPTAANAALLEDTYLGLILGGLHHLKSTGPAVTSCRP
jgi:AcrR family transcriptional regulator